MLYLEVSAAQAELLERLGTNLDRGWTTEEAAAIRRRDSSSSSSSNHNKRNNSLGANVVTPPVNCPGWICCLLPCIKNVPSMKVFRSIRPDDCEVLRNGRWMRYDATALVVGDVVRLETGDAVPADCVVLAIVGEEDTEQHQQDQEADTISSHSNSGSNNNKSNKLNLSSSLSVSSGSIDDLLVDHRHITGEDKPRSSGPLPSLSTTSSTAKVPATACLEGLTVLAAQPQQLFWGGQVVQGSAICVVTAVGAQTLVSSMIRQGTFPATKQQQPSSSSPAMFVSVTANHNQTETDEEAGISLIGRTTV